MRRYGNIPFGPTTIRQTRMVGSSITEILSSSLRQIVPAQVRTVFSTVSAFYQSIKQSRAGTLHPTQAAEKVATGAARAGSGDRSGRIQVLTISGGVRRVAGAFRRSAIFLNSVASQSLKIGKAVRPIVTYLGSMVTKAGRGSFAGIRSGSIQIQPSATITRRVGDVHLEQRNYLVSIVSESNRIRMAGRDVLSTIAGMITTSRRAGWGPRAGTLQVRSSDTITRRIGWVTLHPGTYLNSVILAGLRRVDGGRQIITFIDRLFGAGIRGSFAGIRSALQMINTIEETSRRSHAHLTLNPKTYISGIMQAAREYKEGLKKGQVYGSPLAGQARDFRGRVVRPIAFLAPISSWVRDLPEAGRKVLSYGREIVLDTSRSSSSHAGVTTYSSAVGVHGKSERHRIGRPVMYLVNLTGEARRRAAKTVRPATFVGGIRGRVVVAVQVLASQFIGTVEGAGRRISQVNFNLNIYGSPVQAGSSRSARAYYRVVNAVEPVRVTGSRIVNAVFRSGLYVQTFGTLASEIEACYRQVRTFINEIADGVRTKIPQAIKVPTAARIKVAGTHSVLTRACTYGRVMVARTHSTLISTRTYSRITEIRTFVRFRP